MWHPPWVTRPGSLQGLVGGDVVEVFGPEGVGKSETVLNMVVNCILPHDCGGVEVGGAGLFPQPFAWSHPIPPAFPAPRPTLGSTATLRHSDPIPTQVALRAPSRLPCWHRRCPVWTHRLAWSS